MIKKEKLLKKINEAMDVQKNVLPLLNKHISATVTFSKLEPMEKEEIEARFQEIAILLTKNRRVLQSVHEEVSEGKSNVY